MGDDYYSNMSPPRRVSCLSNHQEKGFTRIVSVSFSTDLQFSLMWVTKLKGTNLISLSARVCSPHTQLLWSVAQRRKEIIEHFFTKQTFSFLGGETFYRHLSNLEEKFLLLSSSAIIRNRTKALQSSHVTAIIRLPIKFPNFFSTFLRCDNLWWKVCEEKHQINEIKEAHLRRRCWRWERW